jgi:hypothetical protein
VLRLVQWVDEDEAGGLQRGEAFGHTPAEGPILRRFCESHGLPWSDRLARLTAIDGALPAALLERNRGRVRLEIDVPWILQDLKVAAQDGVEEELLSLWALEQTGASVRQGLRRLHVLAGLAPAAREEALLGLLRGGADAVDVVLLRGLTDDDVDRYVSEG